MESENIPVPCLNSPGQESGNICPESKAPWLMQDSNKPTLTNLKPMSQTAKLSCLCERTSLKNPSSRYCQLSSKDGIQEFTNVGEVDSCEWLKSINGKKAGWRHIHAANLAALYAKCKTVVTADATAMLLKHSKAGWNGAPSDKLAQVQLLDGLQSQPHNTPQRRFIIFDQSGSTGRIIFYPALVHDFLNPLPNCAKIQEVVNVQNMASVEKRISKNPVKDKLEEWDAKLQWHTGSSTSAVAALQNTHMSQVHAMAVDRLGNEFVTCPEGREQSTSQGSCNEVSQLNSGRSQSLLHENTEDLEALLSFDEEECSTGHSPSEATINTGKTCAEHSTNTSNQNSIKSGRSKQQVYKEEEVDFIPAIIEESIAKAEMNGKCCLLDDSPVITESWESAIRSMRHENIKGAEYYSCKKTCGLNTAGMPRETSSKNSAAKHKQSHIPVLRQSAHSKKLRRKRIKRAVGLLRSIIPGGDCMDTSIILNKTIRYVQSLQLKVKMLEAN